MQRIAAHEAGHALAIIHRRPDAPPTLTLGTQGHLSGATLYNSPRPSALTYGDVDDLLVVFLAGRTAEEVVFGQFSAGAGGSVESDLAQATQLAIRAELSLGLGSTGLLWSEIADPDRGHASLVLRPAHDAAVRARLERAYDEAKKLITSNRVAVDMFAKALLERSVLLPADIANLWRSAESIRTSCEVGEGQSHKQNPKVSKNYIRKN
ncbi:hypothetical protein GCM10010909_25390 [Acidocella aquatica]|uniref:Peptidase M41 domain-containing protein n=2 Tax=Acidocella aquatica TaxID=1922313 RepID=A0ABQ6A969_9PROT|nr:hypothetical protein GCM10010909_25390 [Acidocella aquatica]